jgi:hypothetical protein
MPKGLDDEPGVLYLDCAASGEVHNVRFLCPCGDPNCLHILPVNGHGKVSWGFEEHEDGTVTLSPSIFRRVHHYPERNLSVGCGSHFFIRRNRVDWV